MEIKNLKIFTPSTVTVDVDGEQLVIGKIPAAAALLLYAKHDDGGNLAAALFKVAQFDNSSQDGLMKASEYLVEVLTKYQQTIWQVLEIVLKRPIEWLQEHLGINDVVAILTAILSSVTEDSLSLKKNIKM